MRSAERTALALLLAIAALIILLAALNLGSLFFVRAQSAGHEIGIRLALIEPRIAAAVLFAGSFGPRATFEEARRITIPLQVLLQWDDERVERQPALDLFDAFGTREKTLHANLGGHAGTPWFEVDDAARFFSRHLT